MQQGTLRVLSSSCFGLTPFEHWCESVKVRVRILLQEFDEKSVVMATFCAEYVVSLLRRTATHFTVTQPRQNK
jgi:hypothetical protein